MKKNMLLAILSIVSFGAFAQGSLEKGELQLNAGLGTSGWGTPVYLGLDYGIHEDITLGGHFELESGGHFKLELGGQYYWNLQAAS